MANQVSLEESSEPVQYKKLVLKVSIDCEGCRKRVNKILTKVPGVERIDINMKQQKVTVIGDVDAFYVLKKLKRSGRQVELLPELKLVPQTEKKHEKSKDKEKQPKLQVKGETSRTTGAGGNNKNDRLADDAETPQRQVKAKSPNDKGGDGVAENISAVKPGDEEKSGVFAAEVRQDSSKESKKSDSLEKESDPKGKNKEENDTSGGEPPSTVEKKEGDVVEIEKSATTTKKVDSGNVGKKKKKKGQNGNNVGGVPSSLNDVTGDHGMAPPTYSLPANHVHPRDHHGYYTYERDLYTSPPVYAASYNTSHPSSYATTSYYTALPAESYVHAYSGGLERELSPSDVEAYTRQPLDSLEMFSDENPNGCSIM